jgi:acyl carrier protein
MPQPEREAIRSELLTILTGLRDDWEYSGEITERTGLFSDLEFESIDAVALGTAIEEHYNQSLPFAEFLTKASERKATDITVGELVTFLAQNLHSSKGASA